MLGILTYLWRQDNSPSAYPPIHNFHQHPVFPPPPRPPVAAETLAILVVGVQGKLYLATQAECAAAARRKEDRANVLLS